MLEQVISAYGLRDDATDEAPAPSAPPAAPPAASRETAGAEGDATAAPLCSRPFRFGPRSVWLWQYPSVCLVYSSCEHEEDISSFFLFFILFCSFPSSVSLSLSLFPSSFLTHTYKHKLKDKARLTKQRHKTNSK